ncbi:hypothetical protein N9H39_05990 [Gammaproteobacteria bacterium]|jgi:hypothetical protein|nr:hypothetical protein [Gammaproteobacteria bacterium]
MKSPSTPSPTELHPDSFIYELPVALTPADCDDIIERFEACPEHQYMGRIGQSGSEHPDIKRSTDLRVSGRPENSTNGMWMADLVSSVSDNW